MVADLALWMKELLVAISMVGVISMHRELLLDNRFVAILAAEARRVPILVNTCQEPSESKWTMATSTRRQSYRPFCWGHCWIHRRGNCWGAIWIWIPKAQGVLHGSCQVLTSNVVVLSLVPSVVVSRGLIIPAIAEFPEPPTCRIVNLSRPTVLAHILASISRVSLILIRVPALSVRAVAHPPAWVHVMVHVGIRLLLHLEERRTSP